MPEERTLPISFSHREFVVKVEGVEVGREQQLLALTVTKTINRISAARLVYLDGSASAGDFPLSNTDTFIPGKSVEIWAGPRDDLVSLFSGIIVRQGLKVRESYASQLVVECRHKAVKLTVGRKNTYFFDKTDSDIIGAMLDGASISKDVERTSVSHKQQVQYYSTDWDFLVSRSQANGKIVLTNDGKVAVKTPMFSGRPVCTLQFGATILDLDTEIDARGQYSGVKSAMWDAAQQAVIEKAGTDPTITTPGNLDSAKLSRVVSLGDYRLQHAPVSEEEAQAWADAEWLKSQMGRVRGRAKCEGIGTINPGDLVTMGGIGQRYSGDVFVTGVRHDYDLVQGWKTNIQFGDTEKWLAEEADVTGPKAGALLPAINGLHIGVVVGNEDPDGEDRVRVRMPLLDSDGEGTWARVASPDAGDQRGFFFRPEIGDEVVLGFMNDDPRHAVILGMLNSSAKPAPLKGSDDNHEKVIQSRSKMRIYLNDDKKVIEIDTPAGNKIALDEDAKAIKITDQHGNKIEMTQDGIVIESAKAMTLKAGTEVCFESSSSLSIKAGGELKLEGTSGAELSSTAVTKVKGSLVEIN